MQRILIIGGNGSGKTTFAKALAEKTGLPLVHLDKLFWYGNWQYRHREEFDPLLQKELEKERWILDGNMMRTFPRRLEYCDTVFYLDFSTLRCLWGVTTRVIKNYGKTRPDMGGNCPDHFDLQFYKNILAFNKMHRKNTYELLKTCNKQVFVFKNHRQISKFLKSFSI